MARLLDRYVPAAYRAILTDEFTWRDNPIGRREHLREGRRRDRALLLLIMLGTMLGAFLAAAWALQYFHDSRFLRSGVPVALGGSYPVLFFALFSGIHVWFVWHAAYRRSFYLLLQEYRQNSLATLLCTRIPPFQILLMASAHPFRQGMLAALAGLPFYAWIMSLGGVTLLELGGLYLLFAMISFRPPRWSLPAFSAIPAEEILKRQRSGRPKTWGEWWLANALWFSFIASWYLQWAFGPRWLMKLLWPISTLFSPEVYRILPAFFFTWVLALVRLLWHPIPWFGLQLPPIAIVAPLYLLARLLAVWESSIHLRTGDADTSQSLWDLREYWRVRRLYGMLFPFLLLGFLWKPYVAAGLTSVLLVVNGQPGDAATAGLFYLTGFLAALVCWARAREMSAVRAANGGQLMGERDGLPVEEGAAYEAWYVFSPAVTIYGLYAAACLLTGTAPFPGPALAIAGPLLAMTVAGAIYARGVPPGLRNYALALLLPLAGWLLPVPEIGATVAAISPIAGLLSLTEHTERILREIPYAQPLAAPWYYSAALSLLLGGVSNLLLSRRARTAPEPSWEPGSAYSLLPAAIPSALTGELAAQRLVRSVASEASTSRANAETPPVAAIPAYGEAAPGGGVEQPPLKQKPFSRRQDTPSALRLIAWLQARWDNAVAVKELRVLLRGHLGRDEQIALPLVLIGFLLLALYRADVSSGVLELPARLIFGSEIAGGGPVFTQRGGAAVIFGGMVGAILILMALVGSMMAGTLCGTAFGRERDKSTLGFVLATPMPTHAILFGKFLGMLGPAMLPMALLAAWCGLLCIPVAQEIGIGPTLSGLFFALSICGLLAALSGALGLACSTVFRRESDASSLAILLLFGTLTVVSYLTAVWPQILALGEPEMVPRRWIWVGYLAVADLALIPAALAFTHWRLDRARRGDVAFESASK